MKRNPWSWVPSLYFAEGLPYVLVMTVSVIMYKNLGLSNGDIALYTSWLYLPWVIKPFWSPFVDIIGTKRIWITAMQILIGAGLAGIAFSIPTSFFIQASLSFFWLLAFASATHDIAADGFYMLGLPEEHQSLFVGIRSTFYRISMIAGQGGLVVLAGWLAQSFDNDFVFAWSMVFYVASGLFLAIAAWHLFILPHPTTDCSRTNSVGRDFVRVFTTFIQKKELLVSILFILFFRFGEAQLAKIASPFLLDARSVGGLGLSTTQVGFIYGTVGVLMLLLGGILGGILVSRDGLKHWLWPMVIAMNLPDLVYVFFAYARPESFLTACGGVALEQFGYGFGFTAFMLYLIYFAEGEYKTAHYAICTGLMALGMMLPGMFSGYLQEWMGYPLFFVWVCFCTVPGFLLTALLKIPDGFGRKEE
jgi:PAT family beta-lactamase induction signal transducer AmpG